MKLSTLIIALSTLGYIHETCAQPSVESVQKTYNCIVGCRTMEALHVAQCYQNCIVQNYEAKPLPSAPSDASSVATISDPSLIPATSSENNAATPSPTASLATDSRDSSPTIPSIATSSIQDTRPSLRTLRPVPIPTYNPNISPGNRPHRLIKGPLFVNNILPYDNVVYFFNPIQINSPLLKINTLQKNTNNLEIKIVL
ncbi:uncharacterized protein VTP21DRAFT_4701 [Calcarisporiella thermophila]|uniref:uncharacterized protein n=1 Tax=Calcarisporiella thermophila TaxID=911321 RepID=UPI0037427301